jgi:polyphosphate kinase
MEHSRIFYFENAGSPEVYLGSADWMPRNLYERVEVLFPLKSTVAGAGRVRDSPSLPHRYAKDTVTPFGWLLLVA